MEIRLNSAQPSSASPDCLGGVSEQIPGKLLTLYVDRKLLQLLYCVEQSLSAFVPPQ